MLKSSRLTFSSLVASTAMILLAGVSGTAHANHSVVNAEFCVDATHFRFMMDVDEPDNPPPTNPGGAVTLHLLIGADSAPLTFGITSTEVIGVNFDRDTGGTGSPAFGPDVSLDTIDNIPPPDRWLNETPIIDFAITPFGGAGSGEFRIEGSVPHGTERFTAGDTLADIALRITGASGGDTHLPNIPIEACDNQIGENVTLGFGTTLGIGVIIEDGASIGDFTTIGNQVFIGLNAEIGNGTVLGDGAQIARDVVIGERVKLMSLINTVFHPVVIDKGARVGDDTVLSATEIGAGAIVGINVIARSFVDHDTGEVTVVTIGKKAEVGDFADLDFGTIVGRGVLLEDGVGPEDGVSTTSVLNTVFHPVIFEKGVTVGAGSEFLGHTIVGKDASIGIGVMVGRDVTIGKDASIGDFVTIADGVVVPKDADVPYLTSLP